MNDNMVKHNCNTIKCVFIGEVIFDKYLKYPYISI